MSQIQRLPAPKGLLIDRQQPRHFRFEGKLWEGFAGDTLASALLANDQLVLSRSFKYHRPRGPLSMAGQDGNTLIQLADEPNVLADIQPLVEGLVTSGQNYNGTLANDRDALLGYFSRFMPVGFYYRSFFKPLGSWKFWEKLIRAKAGLGVIDQRHVPEYYDKAFLFHDLVVVGAGPAGLSAALCAAGAGISVLIVDEQPLAGGSLNWHRFDAAGQQARDLREQLLEDIAAADNITMMAGATCNGWFTDNFLPVIQGKRMYKVRAKECIIAAGSFEQHVVFRNNDLPGVMLSSAASRLIELYGVRPGRQAVVLTGNDDGYHTALQLLDNGIAVKAVVDMRQLPSDSEPVMALKARQVPVLQGHTVYEARAAKSRLAAVEVRSITGKGQVADEKRVIACDLLSMSAGYMPAWQLLCQAGAKLSYDDGAAEFALTQLPAHVHIAGSVNSVHTLDRVLADGERAALAALENLGLGDSVSPAEMAGSSGQPGISVKPEASMNFPWPIFPHPKGKDFVDFDEDLQSRDILNATRMGYRDVQLVKRFSTVGMGPSQGRHSALPTARLIADATGRSVTETGVTTSRPPFVAEKLSHLAGRGFDPYRRTAMHHRHVQLGASMMPAGNWQRPAFYGTPSQRHSCVQAEALHVRKQVGLIDVSTLGGIELSGPDAAEFMNRMYTFAFLKQPVDKTRYAVMTSEQGVVIDDGVACRISEEHFYVTTTTSGVDRVYQDMQKWNVQWRLQVDIVNVTSAFAAVNLAGPSARDVLTKITTLDLSPPAFPFLAYREAAVAGIPARLLRVGFVGELGYEIHVPTRCGEALWDALMKAGAEFDIRPFGVEAQRLLRLEKGHIIVGQDTDGMSHPGEVGLDWAISRNKPFFVGGRSLQILQRQEQRRRLAGFVLPRDSLRPEEGHLVLSDDRVTGNVTSCEYSPALDAIIGLAYVAVDDALPGAAITIRADGGALVRATVVALPFYDPDNQRQEP